MSALKPKSAPLSREVLISRGFREGADGSWAKPFVGADGHSTPSAAMPATSFLRKTSGRKPSDIVAEPKERALRAPKAMNKTETAFFALLEARRRAGEFTRVEFEGMTLKWGGGMRYTADFVAFKPDGKVVLFEVKGGFIFYHGSVRFRGCRHEWPEFEFELHQRTRGEWRRNL